MPLIVTEAIVLHAFDYLETSRVIRLVTREAGVQSVLARGARRSKSRFGAAVDIFAQGTAHFIAHPGRELHTLTSFDVTRSRSELGTGFARFMGAAAIAELALRFGRDEPLPELYDAVESALDTLAAASDTDAAERALAGAWGLVTALGFTPALESCASCHIDITPDASVTFSAPAGGALCARCAGQGRAGRTLPADARAMLTAWHRGEHAQLEDDAIVRAHQRLLREFVQEHLAEGKPLRAFDVWERERWSA
jgi:DNA repair protein RecO (recombination protein O)